jgi:hypothetical protein
VGWIQKQRSAYKKDKLSQDHIVKLNNINFTWNIHDDSWENLYSDIRSFKKEYGHCYVLSNYKRNPKLYIQCKSLRTRKRLGRLSNERIKLLNKIGFIWNLTEYIWKYMYKELRKYYRKYGNCNVPRDYKCKNMFNKSLPRWVNAQRDRYNQNKLSTERITKLNKIKFCWDTIVDNQNKMFSCLCRYKKKNGHCNVPVDYKKDTALAHYVNILQKKQKMGKLSNNRIRELDNIGFVWNPPDKRWFYNLINLIKYFTLNGHCNVPRTYYDKKLANWVKTQRKLKIRDALKEEYINILDTFNFRWRV